MPKRLEKKIFGNLQGKQLLWLRAYLDDSNPLTFLNKTESTLAAGYKPSNGNRAYAASIGCVNYKKFKDRINSWLEEAGLSETYLKRKLINLIEAKETKFFAHEGKITDQVDVEALGIQRQSLDMAIKVKGMYEADNKQKGEAEAKLLAELFADVPQLVQMLQDRLKPPDVGQKAITDGQG